VAAHLDRVAHLHVLFLGALQKDALGIGGFERPRCRLALLAFDVDVDNRVRDDEHDLLDRALHHRPRRQVVVTV